MARSHKTYAGIAAVFLTSIALIAWLPPGELFQQLAAIPLVGSLLGVLFQLLREQAAHDRALAVIEAQNLFSLGTSSHMANVAFDKHVLFCEEYISEVHQTLRTLFSEGPSSKVLKHTEQLYDIQRKYTVWLTDKIEADLELFESALRRIGANSRYLEVSPAAKDHAQRIALTYKTFASVMGADRMGSTEWEGESLSEELAISMVIRRLRTVLGTEELTKMRNTIVANALAVPGGG